MNDNPREPMPERLAREKNIAANGRLGVGGAFVLAIHSGHLRIGLVLVLVVFTAWLAEQLPDRWRLLAFLIMLAQILPTLGYLATRL